jgi:hypothetical protein
VSGGLQAEVRLRLLAVLANLVRRQRLRSRVLFRAPAAPALRRGRRQAEARLRLLAVLANLVRLALLLRRARAVVGVFGVLEVLARRYSLRDERRLPLY